MTTRIVFFLVYGDSGWYYHRSVALPGHGGKCNSGQHSYRDFVEFCCHGV